MALTLVLAKKPELFLLDEPMANLDPLARQEFLSAMLGACTETGAAVLFSSHAVAELERICGELTAAGMTGPGRPPPPPASAWLVPFSETERTQLTAAMTS